MQIQHLLLQKSEGRRAQGNLSEFSLTELIMLGGGGREGRRKKKLERIVNLASQRIRSVPSSSEVSASHCTRCLQLDDQKHPKQMPCSMQEP